MQCIIVKKIYNFFVKFSNFMYNILMDNKHHIDIIRGKYKNIRLKISNNGEISLYAPKSLSNEKIIDFIKTKRKWIEKHIEKIDNMNKVKSTYDFENYGYIFNNAVPFGDIKKDTFYRNAFLNYIKPMVHELSIRCNLYYTSLSIVNSKRAWGSLDSNKRMKLNWKIVILPKELIVYIIIHELCHSQEFNHSKYFWSLVGEYLPNYKEIKEELKNFSFLLTSNIL